MSWDYSKGKWKHPRKMRSQFDASTEKGAIACADGTLGAAVLSLIAHVLTAAGSFNDPGVKTLFGGDNITAAALLVVAALQLTLGLLHKQRKTVPLSVLMLLICILQCFPTLVFPLYGYPSPGKFAGGAVFLSVLGVFGSAALKRIRSPNP